MDPRRWASAGGNWAGAFVLQAAGGGIGWECGVCGCGREFCLDKCFYVGVPLLPQVCLPSWSSPLSFVLSCNVMKGDIIIPTKQTPLVTAWVLCAPLICIPPIARELCAPLPFIQLPKCTKALNSHSIL